MKLSNKLTRRDLLILAAAVTLIAAIYLFASKFTYAIGFPLDDSWIHQTYARNLALRGEWAFRPGIPSAGSTAPLWSALLAIGFILRLSPYIWTYFLGGLTLFGLAVFCEWAARQIVPAYCPRFPLIGFFFVFEWHLAWAAMSGMETLLHGLLMTVALVLLMKDSRRYLTFGLLTGLAVWVRPDGLTLLGPVVMVILFVEKDNSARVSAFVRYLIGFGALFVPYLFFNLAIGGVPLPNTFYAKQAEYAVWQTKPILERLARMLLQLWIGPGLALIPGVVIWSVLSIKRRAWGSLAALIWCAGYLWLYVSRLPVYQHGRYLMPAMPIFFLFGLLGFLEFANSKIFKRYHWFVQTLWQASVVAVTCLFVILGARSYAQDVAVIESEMVLTAKWVSENLPADALIAAHDIGALGYFDNPVCSLKNQCNIQDYHELIDLAGLVSPDVIPFIRDEPRLALYLNERGADYLIAFPGFYPALAQIAEKVYVTNSSFAPGFGEENMTVFRWISP